MTATHCVKDTENQIIGFLVDGVFYTDYNIKENIQYIENLFLSEKGDIVTNENLPKCTYQQAVNGVKYQLIAQENYFQRDIQEELLCWKQDALHKVLQLEGSRQIGKTTELLKFAYAQYEYIIYISLFEDSYQFTEVLRCGCTPLEMEKYCRRAQLPHFVNSRKTIIIIDEIQVSPMVYNSIRMIRANLDCDLIVTGSYLGQTLNKEFFQPAGTVAYLYMYPLSFSEFCRIFEKEDLLKTLDLYGGEENASLCKKDLENRESCAGYTELYKLYELYKKIGGYPEAVKAYAKTHNIVKCYEVIENLLITFEKESRNYFRESKEPLIFRTVYTEALKEMCREKRGTGSKLVETITGMTKTEIAVNSPKQMISRTEISNAVAWLGYSGIIGECGLYNNGDVNDYIPARRLYYMDCGIASYVAEQTALPKDNIDGFLSENFVYTELMRLYKKRAGEKLVKGESPCFSIYGGYELDFMILGKDNTIYGLEVKTNTGAPASLKVFIDKKLVDRGIVAKKTTGGHSEQFDTIPIYMVGVRFPYI